MSDMHPDDTRSQREVVERHEVVERNGPPGRRDAPPASPLVWVWLVPLLVVVLVLLWFVFTRGEPRQPVVDETITIPELEAPPAVQEERRIEIEVPAEPREPPREP